MISIHALRKESDFLQFLLSGLHVIFQSTLSVRRATSLATNLSQSSEFQSTLSVRRATPRTPDAVRRQSKFQSTLSVRRATYKVHLDAAPTDISIHALRKESDVARHRIQMHLVISIHALRKESDLPLNSRPVIRLQFQSTLSVRRATSALQWRVRNLLFQSTLSVRRATLIHTIGQTHVVISIHALRKESDFIPNYLISSDFVFQSTLSVRRATMLLP